jgi:hypothetical protein
VIWHTEKNINQKMRWGAITSVFLFATFKFMVAPFTGRHAFHLSFFETFLACTAGGIFSAAIFYYSSEFFIRRTERKVKTLKQEALKKGIIYQEKRKFTRMNRFIIRLKKAFGIIGISFWAPFLLSVPIGSMIVAKFYGHDKRTFPLVILGMFFNSFIMTGIAYLGHLKM